MNFLGKRDPSRFKYHFQIVLGKMLQPEAKGPADHEMPYVRAANVLDGRIDINDFKTMWFAPSERVKFNIKLGDLLVLEGGDVGRCALWLNTVEDIGFQNSIHRLRALRGNSNRFAAYWLHHLKMSGYFELVCSKATLAHFTGEKFKETPFPRIGLSTQEAIADFLDHETVRIDLLIEKKKCQVTLLAAKQARQTDLILSDLEHDIPRQSLRWLIRVRSGDFIDNTEMEKDKSDSMAIPVIGGNGIMAFSNKHNTQGNTVIVGRVGALCGNVHLTFEKAWITDNALIVTLLGHQFSAAYLFEILTAAKLNEKANKSAQPLITGEMVKAHKVAVPSSTAQAHACHQISVIRDEFNVLTRRIDESLIRLREFRSVLISAAVTGQIDVAAWGKRGTTDRRLDDIGAEMAAAKPPEREKARA